MIKITSQEFVKRYDALPESFREEFLSDENVNMLWTIGGAHHLSGERIQKIAGVVGYAVLDLVHLEDISKEIAIEAGVDKRLADELAREIKLKILNPIIPHLQQLYHYGSTGSSQATPPQPEILRPAFAPPSGEGQPFILHEEQVYPPSAVGGDGGQTRPREETLVRPSFYDPPSHEASEGRREQERPGESIAARLEIGPSIDSGQAERKEARVGRTEAPPVRVVHYSGPQTPVDPFAPQPPSAKASEGKQEPPKEVHPENIVDLKDLPK
ncbi:MAG: hypothetical protein WD889_00740 [Candidatus Colwellbacteria bacterium]